MADENFKESFSLMQFLVFLVVFVVFMLQGPIVRWLQIVA